MWDKNLFANNNIAFTPSKSKAMKANNVTENCPSGIDNNDSQENIGCLML